MVSVATAWLLAGLSLLVPAAVLFVMVTARQLASLGQLLLNRRLATELPLGPRPAADRALLVATLAGFALHAAWREASPALAAALIMPGLVPLSLLHLRTSLRSYAADERFAMALSRRVQPAVVPGARLEDGPELAAAA